MNSFKCEHCKTLISDTPHGYITECEHYPMGKLEPQARNERSDFMRVLAEFARDTNAVTRSVHRDILKGRLDRNDVS